jgi:hypothetical protein
MTVRRLHQNRFPSGNAVGTAEDMHLELEEKFNKINKVLETKIPGKCL